MSTNNRQRMLAHIGRLAQQRRGEKGVGRASFAVAAGIGSDSTVKTFEFGRTEPSIPTQLRMEKALDWRHGVIRDVLDAAETGQAHPDDVDMEYMDGREIPEPANRASELDDVELLTEVIRRLGEWRGRLGGEDSGHPVAPVTPLPTRPMLMAASHESTDPKTRKN